MRLDELLAACAASDSEHWELLPGGPLFLTELGRAGTTEEPGVEVLGSHWNRATYRPDVSIGLAWGFRVDSDWEERISPDWVERAAIPDRTSTQCYLDHLYNGSPVYRDYYFVADGGRVYLPAPERNGDRLTVSQRLYNLIHMLNALEGMPYIESYANYCKRAGFEIV